MKTLLVTGGSGQVGSAVRSLAWPEGWRLVAPGRDDLDLGNAEALRSAVLSHGPAAVINAAAYTAVDRAESDVVAAWQVNALAPAALATACREAGVPLIHLSTDYVFDGSKDGAWEVDDPVAPLGVYGASKLGGELAVRTACPRHVIVRTAWVVSAGGANFVRTMLRVGAERERVRVVADQRGSPTSADDLAAALQQIALRVADDPGAPVGTFHFSNAGATTWHAFAQAIFAGSAQRGGPSPIVEAIATADYPTPARRPANSLLSHRAIGEAYRITPRLWRDALDDILDRLIGPRKDLQA